MLSNIIQLALLGLKQSVSSIYDFKCISNYKTPFGVISNVILRCVIPFKPTMTDDHLPFREINIKLANELEVKLNVLDNSKGLMEDYYTKGKDLPYYADIWPAGVGLGILLASNRFDLKGKHILDIGR